MKKIYSLAILALAAGMSAQAAPTAKTVNTVSKDAEVSSVIENAIVSPKKQQLPAKKITSGKDVLGDYRTTYKWGLNANEIPSMSPTILPGTTENEVIIRGLPYEDIDIVAFVDPAESTLIINTQDMYYHQNYAENVVLTFFHFNADNSVTQFDQIKGKIQDDGTIVFPEDDMIGYYLFGQAGWIYGWYDFVMYPIKPFEFNASEWTSIGTAQFTDGWLLSAIEEDLGIPAQSVEIMKHNTIKGDYLLVNPYMTADYTAVVEQGFGGYTANGYIRFNMADPDCVYVYPLVGSGAWLDLYNDGNPLQIFPFNNEGYYIILANYSAEEVIEEFDMNFLDVSCYEDGCAYIYNLFFGITGSMISRYQWVDQYETPIVGMSTIEFDGDAGVNDIVVEGGNAPVKYYNLQGVEISNPVKGQIVIKNEGSKSTKYFAK